MPEFLVRLHEPPAPARRVRVHAEHANAVAQVLGVLPMQVLDVAPAAAASRGPWRWRFQHTKPLDLRLFAQELAVLLQAGIPLLEALQTLREKDRHAAMLDSVLEALRAGLPLSAALAREGTHFDALFTALVAASERSGQLAQTLQHHAVYLGWSAALRARLVAASVYPLLLLGAGGAVIMFLLLYVLPRFAGVFDGLGRELPWGSRALMSLGVLAAAHPAWSLALGAAVPALALLAWHWPPLRQAAVRLAWRSPGLGERLRTVALARLYRCLGLLAAAGVPVPTALQLAEPVLATPLRPALRTATAAVAAGQRLSAALQAQGLATPVAQRMLRVGESSGQLAAMLERAAAFHDDEIARLSDLVTRVVNPVLMLVMGVLIGGIVVLMYLPIFSLMEQVQ